MCVCVSLAVAVAAAAVVVVVAVAAAAASPGHLVVAVHVSQMSSYTSFTRGVQGKKKAIYCGVYFEHDEETFMGVITLHDSLTNKSAALILFSPSYLLGSRKVLLFFSFFFS